MLRTIGKWLIGRAIEREAPLPRWLRWWVDRDEELSRFESASQRLGALLRRDAAGWMARQTLEVRKELTGSALVRWSDPPRGWTRRRTAWSLTACALAASALFALANWPTTGHDAAPPDSSGGGRLANGQLASDRDVESIPRIERQRLIAAWRAGRANVNEWKERVKGVSGKIEVLGLREAAAIFAPAEAAGATTERVLAALDAAMASQRQELTSGMRSAYVFFAHRLPASVAHLVGWQEG